MATFSGLITARDLWLLQKFTQCHLATEETLADRVSVRDGALRLKEISWWFVDDGRSGLRLWLDGMRFGWDHNALMQ